MSHFRSAVAAAALCLLPFAAQAAPQVLGLVASNGYATPLNCDGLKCSAQFSAFCLQDARHAPARGTAYSLAPGSEIMLALKTADGRTLRLPGEGYLEYRTLIGFTSVEIGMPERTFALLAARHRATLIAVEVGKAASLVPVEQPGDPSPQGDDEIAVATGPMRLAAERLFEQPGGSGDTARLTNLLINALPKEPAEQIAVGERFWLADNPALAAAAPEGRLAAGRIYRGCRIAVDSRSALSLRNCLELQHADLMATTNHRFWREAGGS